MATSRDRRIRPIDLLYANMTKAHRPVLLFKEPHFIQSDVHGPRDDEVGQKLLHSPTCIVPLSSGWTLLLCQHCLDGAHRRVIEPRKYEDIDFALLLFAQCRFKPEGERDQGGLIDSPDVQRRKLLES